MSVGIALSSELPDLSSARPGEDEAMHRRGGDTSRGTAAEQMLRAADAAMYRSKHAGRPPSAGPAAPLCGGPGPPAAREPEPNGLAPTSVGVVG